MDKEEWEVEFDKVWKQNGLHLGYKNQKHEPVKDFIRTLHQKALEEGREDARKVIGGEISWLMDTYNYEDHEVKESAQVEILQKVDEKIVALSKLREA